MNDPKHYFLFLHYEGSENNLLLIKFKISVVKLTHCGTDLILSSKQVKVFYSIININTIKNSH